MSCKEEALSRSNVVSSLWSETSGTVVVVCPPRLAGFTLLLTQWKENAHTHTQRVALADWVCPLV